MTASNTSVIILICVSISTVYEIFSSVSTSLTNHSGCAYCTSHFLSRMWFDSSSAAHCCDVAHTLCLSRDSPWLPFAISSVWGRKLSWCLKSLLVLLSDGVVSADYITFVCHFLAGFDVSLVCSIFNSANTLTVNCCFNQMRLNSSLVVSLLAKYCLVKLTSWLSAYHSITGREMDCLEVVIVWPGLVGGEQVILGNPAIVVVVRIEQD